MLRLARIFPFVFAAALLPVAASAVTTPAASYQLTAPLTAAKATVTSGLFTATVASTGATGLLTWKLTYKGLKDPALAAYIRLGPAGKNGTAAIRLCRPCTSGSQGSVATQIGAGSQLLKTILAGGAYVTVETKLNPSGQLRGQLKAAQIVSNTSAPALAGAATLAPATAGGASGTSQLSWDPSTNVLTVTVDLLGLSAGGNYTGQITPGCAAASGHLYKLADFVADSQGQAHVVTQVTDVAALNVSGAWAVKIGNPGTGQGGPAGGGGGGQGGPGGGGGGQGVPGGGGQAAAPLGQLSCGLVAAPGATAGTGSTAAVLQPVTVWQAGTGRVANAAQAAKLAIAVVQKRGWSSLSFDEVHIFPDWFEVEFTDADGLQGPEIYVNAESGDVGPEQGPSLGWDTVYGKGQCTTVLSEAAARQIAQNALGTHPGAAGETLGDGEHHHGYWEFGLVRQGKEVNQLNVNECTQRAVFEDLWQPDMIGVYAPNG